jgi:hypothetical protein
MVAQIRSAPSKEIGMDCIAPSIALVPLSHSYHEHLSKPVKPGGAAVLNPNTMASPSAQLRNDPHTLTGCQWPEASGYASRVCSSTG